MTLVRDDPAPPKGRGIARTGVSVICVAEDAYERPVPAGGAVLNGAGECTGFITAAEWGLLETPILLTSTMQVGRVYDAACELMIERHPEVADDVVIPVVAECDDSFLNDVTSFPLADADVFAALDAAAGGDVAEGCVGAGTGMHCMDFKGGIGTASRTVPAGWTVGVLTLTNFGDRQHLRVDGVPVGREITDLMPVEHREGSCIVVVATDAPMLPHQVRRLAVRAGLGLARCGSTANNGSGELMIAFSTANRIPLGSPDGTLTVRAILDGAGDDSQDLFDDLFAATVEAVEESVVNALFVAETTTGRDGHVYHALPIERTLEILARQGRGPR